MTNREVLKSLKDKYALYCFGKMFIKYFNEHGELDLEKLLEEQFVGDLK